MIFTVKTLNLNFKIGQNIKIVLKLKTKAINKTEIKLLHLPSTLEKEIVLFFLSHHKIEGHLWGLDL